MVPTRKENGSRPPPDRAERRSLPSVFENGTGNGGAAIWHSVFSTSFRHLRPVGRVAPRAPAVSVLSASLISATLHQEPIAFGEEATGAG